MRKYKRGGITVTVYGRPKTGKTRMLTFIAKSLNKLRKGDEYFDLTERDIEMYEVSE